MNDLQRALIMTQIDIHERRQKPWTKWLQGKGPYPHQEALWAYCKEAREMQKHG